MTRFLKLKNMIINTAHILEVHNINNVPVPYYLIYKSNIDFFELTIFGNGFIGNGVNRISICSKNSSADYYTIQKWIQSKNKSDFIDVE
jgi:hypothetical protein